MNKKSFRLTGLIAATHTAMHSDGSLNLEVIDQQATLMINDGVSGVFICGTTGEGLSLSTEERMQVAGRWRKALTTDMPRLIVHVGHNSLPEAVTLARHAEKIGADAICIAAPNYFKALSVDDLLAFCTPVAAAAPTLPFYYYDIPALSGVNLSMTEFMTKAGSMIPTFAGLKFSSANLPVLQECMTVDNGHYDLLYGCDEMLLSALVLGVRGAVGSTYSYAAPLYRKIIAAFDQGDLIRARALQLMSVQMINILQPFGVLAAGKTVMSLRGVDCGPVRPPVKVLSGDQRAKLLKTFEASGILSEIVGS